MFKCKIALEAFDTTNEKVDNINFPQAKNLSKAAVKKLAGNEEERTPFYVVRDYFEKNGKPEGDFIAFGTAKKLAMHFSKQEIKGKGIAKDKKKAAFGEAYIKTVQGKQLLHLEPDPACKIPNGIWPKLLKSLKPMLAGFKATVVLDGAIILEEGDTLETPTTAIEDKLTYKAQIANSLLEEVKEITAVYDREKKEKLAKKITKWLEAYRALSPKEQTPLLKKTHKEIQLVARKIQAILDTDDKITLHLDKVFERVDDYLAIEDTTSKAATQLADKIITALNKITPSIEEIGDKALLKVCHTIQQNLL